MTTESETRKKSLIIHLWHEGGLRTPQVPDEDRVEEMDREDLASVPADLRPIDVGHEEDDRRGLTPGYN